MTNQLLVITGPTGVGKSAFAVDVAEQLGGEIVSADSRQVYRFMSIGTARPSGEVRARIPHHLIDFLDPDANYSLAVFLRLAKEAILSIKKRGRLPILVGGTGQYVWGLLEGWRVPEVPPDDALRRRLHERVISEGLDALVDELSQIAPNAALKIDVKNPRRVIRALEVAYSESGPIDVREPNEPPPYDALVVGLTLERSELYRRIDERVDEMMEAGFLDEVRELLERGYKPEQPSMSSVGYEELARHIRGELTLESAIEKVKFRTHRYARQQYSWFRLTDPRIRWFDASSGLSEAERVVNKWLGKGAHGE